MVVTADFPTWFRAGCYGGLACSLLAAAGVAAYALLRRRGTPRQLAGAMLGCLAATVCILPAIIWNETRLNLQGLTLSSSEVLLWLAWVAVIGWMLPLGTSAWFLLLAAPFDARQMRLRSGKSAARSKPTPPSVDERQREPLGPGIAWGRLTYLDGKYAQHQIALTRQVILLGRERDNDILLEADLASRYHAQLRLDRGHAYLLDSGSMNGTSVNGQKIWGLAPLEDGDVLEVGGQRFSFTDLRPQGSARNATPKEQRGGEQLDETAALSALSPQPTRPGIPAGRLIVTGGPEAGKTVSLHGAIVTIGRESECDLVIPDASISRRHAQVLCQESGWYIQDMGSRNGTALNGQRLTAPHRLEDGDMVMLGVIPLRYLAISAQDEEVAPAALPAPHPATGSSEEIAADTRRPLTGSLPSRPPTVPLRGREKPTPLRLPTRPLQSSAPSPEAAPEPGKAAPIQLSNSTFRPHRLVADRAFLAPRQQSSEQQE